MHQVNRNDTINRLLIALLTVMILITTVFAGGVTLTLAEDAGSEDTTVPPAESGTCGPELSWSFYAGTLTITGKGAMTDFSEPDMAPWYPLRAQITRVVFPKDLSSIGDLAFYECVNLKTVILPDRVNKIGNYAFASCENLEMLGLSAALRSIGGAAFYGCLRLQAVTFPDGLERLGFQAFYRCESLSTVTVPKNVTTMGSSVFAYCKKLVKAEIKAPLTSLPEWTFYGCERLTIVVLPETMRGVGGYAFKRCRGLSSVYYSGDNADEIREEIEEDVPDFSFGGYVGSGDAGGSNKSTSFTENEDGSVTQEDVTVTEDEDMSVVSTVVKNQPASEPDDTPAPGNSQDAEGSFSADITVTVEDKKGWQNAKKAVEKALKEISESTSGQTASKNTTVTVYTKEGVTLDPDFLKAMAGRDITLIIVSPDGSSWKLNCLDLVQGDLSGKYNYSYALLRADASVCKKLGTNSCYQLLFTESAQINAEVIIQLPVGIVNSNAFLYQIEKDKSLTRLQAVAVDNDSRAHFYLASVDQKTTYIIGLNVPSESTDDVIIPEELYGQYNNAIDRLEKIEYTVTGVTSSWGLNFWQVTGIMVGVIVGAALIIGGVMFVVNRQKMKLARVRQGLPAKETKSRKGKSRKRKK